METLQITKANAVKAYNSATKLQKQLLENMFGNEPFKPVKITDRVKTIADVLDIAKPSGDIMFLLNYSGTDSRMIGAKNFTLAELIAEVLNEGWVADPYNTNQAKWYPIFDGTKKLAFSLSYCDFWCSHTFAGSRLAFKSEELSNYAGRTFTEIYHKTIIK